jgi:hypothetical protein
MKGHFGRNISGCQVQEIWYPRTMNVKQSTTQVEMEQAATYLKDNFGNFLEDLKTLARIPSVSFDGFPAAEVARSAEAVASLLKARGLENVKI